MIPVNQHLSCQLCHYSIIDFFNRLVVLLSSGSFISCYHHIILIVFVVCKFVELNAEYQTTKAIGLIHYRTTVVFWVLSFSMLTILAHIILTETLFFSNLYPRV